MRKSFVSAVFGIKQSLIMRENKHCLQMMIKLNLNSISRRSMEDTAENRTSRERAMTEFRESVCIEPFGGTVIECVMSPTPVIVKDYEVFNAEFIKRFKPEVVRRWALKYYSFVRLPPWTPQLQKLSHRHEKDEMEPDS